MRRAYRHTQALTKRLNGQLYRILLWARNHKRQQGWKETAMKKAAVIFSARADELMAYTFRSRVKTQLGKKAKDLTPAQASSAKASPVKDALKGFERLLDDFTA